MFGLIYGRKLMMNGVMQESMRSKEEKRAFWRQHQLAWEVSGLSRTAYCLREKLKLSSFDYQRARLRALDAMSAHQNSVPAPIPPENNAAAMPAHNNRFIPAVRSGATLLHDPVSMRTDAQERIHVQSPDGWCIQLSLRQVTHHPTVITSLLQLLGRSP